MNEKILFVLTFVISSIIFAKNEVNVYTHRHYDSDQSLFQKFEKETGIKVNVVNASADELIKKLELEGKRTPADILITVDAARLHRAKSKNLLQPVISESLIKNVPSHLRDKDSYWYGLTYRARVIVYDPNKTNINDLSTYEDLANPKWKGKILTRSSSNAYNQSLIASIIAHNGEEKTFEWAKGIVNNFARTPKGNDRDQAKAVLANEGELAIMNTYYIGKMYNSSNELERKVARTLKIFFPNQNGRGAHINVSGIGVTKYSKNKENAIKFIEFLTSEAAQKDFAEANYEYPVNPNVEASKLVKSWGSFKADTLNLSILGELNENAVKIADRAGWK
ncbi:iron(III) transport system substrate-binding protein [Hypnocyclicus thermotrophus]|uniref:Iron(III) transport system substrate-binding protein n=1 Tax=Hypnocyclicus thermotrophus TaxID=1627895 RepID=A0AA46DZ40_9FUSO|nr:Fe(3+) ABC transporter substrate-binding protein [Hypnocyclicus thermotrophus]TDT70590.1 iron(III) transport system substrate-binding protein [Hypnocyclicus thermotrophus]